MATISGTEYLAIAQDYANAYEGQVALVDHFYDSVQQLRCLDDVSITLDLLGDFYTAYNLMQSRMQDTTSYAAAVLTLQRHVNRTSGLAVDAWITAHVPGGKIPYAWALLSKQAGFNIDSVIDYTTESSSSSSSS